MFLLPLEQQVGWGVGADRLACRLGRQLLVAQRPAEGLADELDLFNVAQRLRPSQAVDLPGLLVLSRCGDGYGGEVGRVDRRAGCLAVRATNDVPGLELPRDIERPLQGISRSDLQSQERPLQLRVPDLALDVVVEGSDSVRLRFGGVVNRS